MRIVKKEYNFSHIDGNLRLVALSKEERKKLAKTYGTEKWALSANLYYMEFSSLSNKWSYRGYGIKDSNGNIEFINPHYMKVPITLSNTGYVAILNKEKEATKKCCLFFTFMDYQAFQSIQEKDFLSLPDDCDCYILSHVNNFIQMVVDTDEYEDIYMFFPNDDVGKTIAKTIEHRNFKHVHDCSVLYRANNTLSEFATAYLEAVKK